MLLFGKMLQFTHPHSTIPFPGCQPPPPEILRENDIRSVTVVRMEVPCCSGIENAVKRALQASGKMIPWSVVIISTDGRIIN